MALRDSDPREVGGYALEDRLGSGGMGVVYRARSASGRPLAVKVVHDQYADDAEFRIRFRREVAAARQVSGAFTAPVVDADADAPSPWMATLYIPGENLGAHVRRDGPLPAARLRELAAGLAEALRDIHRVGVVHRDLKPANVMLAEDGPRVIDFGVSRAAEALAGDALTQTGRVMGTPPYMSPEQLASPRDVGPASDVFSLGSVLAYAAAGRGPFDADSPYETATRVVQGDPELTGVPEDLAPLVAQCLAKEPKERPTPDELLALLRGEPAPPRPPRAERPPPRPGRRRRRRVIAGAVGGLLAAVLGAGIAVRPAGGGKAPSDLPAGWRAWSAVADDPEKGKGGIGAVDRLAGCVAVRKGLVCAGDEIEAVRFSLATGDVAWSLPVDPTPDGQGKGEGSVIGARGDRVFVYRNDQDGGEDAGPDPVDHYEIRALDARTGKEIWATRVQDGREAPAPDPDADPDSGGGPGAAYTGEGILTVHGAEGTSYALLDPADGRVRWQRRLPFPDSCKLAAAAGHGYLICSVPDRDATRVSRIAPATGRPDWTVTARGNLALVGQAHGKLLFTDGTQQRWHRITALDVTTRRAADLRLTDPLPADADVHLGDGTLYCVTSSGRVRAVDPRTGRRLWSENSTVEIPGPPLAAGSRLYLASPNGRLAALDRSTGEVAWTRPGRDSAPGEFDINPSGGGAPLTLVGDALYVPYGLRSVYTVDVRNP